MLATTLWRDRRNGALDQLQQFLLHAFTGYFPSNRRVIGFAGYLVDFVDVDDAHLGLLNVGIALLQKLLDNVLDILAHIARLGEGSGIGDGEGHIEQACQRFGQQRLTRAGWTDQQNVALAQLDFFFLVALVQALVVVVNGHRQALLGALLTNDVLVENAADLLRRRQFVDRKSDVVGKSRSG